LVKWINEGIFLFHLTSSLGLCLHLSCLMAIWWLLLSSYHVHVHSKQKKINRGRVVPHMWVPFCRGNNFPPAVREARETSRYLDILLSWAKLERSGARYRVCCEVAKKRTQIWGTWLKICHPPLKSSLCHPLHHFTDHLPSVTGVTEGAGCLWAEKQGRQQGH
jgi:hypothetical protein